MNWKCVRDPGCRARLKPVLKKVFPTRFCVRIRKLKGLQLGSAGGKRAAKKNGSKNGGSDTQDETQTLKQTCHYTHSNRNQTQRNRAQSESRSRFRSNRNLQRSIKDSSLVNQTRRSSSCAVLLEAAGCGALAFSCAGCDSSPKTGGNLEQLPSASGRATSVVPTPHTGTRRPSYCSVPVCVRVCVSRE